VGGRSSGKQPTSLGRGGALARRGGACDPHFVRTKSGGGRRRLSSWRDARPRSCAMDARRHRQRRSARKTRYAEIYGALADGIRSGRYRSAAGCRPRPSCAPPIASAGTRCASDPPPVRQGLVAASPASEASCCGARAPGLHPAHSALQDLLAYVKTAQLEILEARDVKAGATEARLLKCRRGQAWHRLVALSTCAARAGRCLRAGLRAPRHPAAARRARPARRPTCTSSSRTRSASRSSPSSRSSRPSAASGREAAALGVTAGHAGFVIARRYVTRRGDTVLVTSTILAADQRMNLLDA